MKLMRPALPPAAVGLRSRVYAVVRPSPKGRLATYGQVADLDRRLRCARQVGWSVCVVSPCLTGPLATGRQRRWPNQHEPQPAERQRLIQRELLIAEGKIPVMGRAAGPAELSLGAAMPLPNHDRCAGSRCFAGCLQARSRRLDSRRVPGGASGRGGRGLCDLALERDCARLPRSLPPDVPGDPSFCFGAIRHPRAAPGAWLASSARCPPNFSPPSCAGCCPAPLPACSPTERFPAQRR